MIFQSALELNSTPPILSILLIGLFNDATHNKMMGVDKTHVIHTYLELVKVFGHGYFVCQKVSVVFRYHSVNKIK